MCDETFSASGTTELVTFQKADERSTNCNKHLVNLFNSFKVTSLTVTL
jgi:hypothetical protein